VTRLPYVYRLRPLPSIDEELDWFFNRAECDMGVSSNYEQALGARSASAHRTPEDAADAAHRCRRIRNWLKAIVDSDAGILQASYELRPWPVALFDQLGRLTGIVVKLACALDLLHSDRDRQRLIEMARAEWLVSSGAPMRLNASLCRIRREAEVRFVRAHRSYSIVRGRAGGGRP
jgi:hypothetical protein